MNFYRGIPRLAACMALAIALPPCVSAQQAKSQPAATQGTSIHEAIEWLDVWVPETGVSNLPRVLLIGDSITKGYYPEVAEKLKGKATVTRLATSKSLGDPAYFAELKLLLSQYHFDVIHFNNGMHGWDYTESTYEASFPQLISILRKGAPGAKLIWANTTPVREKGDLQRLAARTERVKERNRIAARFIAKEQIPVDDIYSLVSEHPEYYKLDGTHFNPTGTAAEAAQVAQRILELLK